MGRTSCGERPRSAIKQTNVASAETENTTNTRGASASSNIKESIKDPRGRAAESREIKALETRCKAEDPTRHNSARREAKGSFRLGWGARKEEIEHANAVWDSRRQSAGG